MLRGVSFIVEGLGKGLKVRDDGILVGSGVRGQDWRGVGRADLRFLRAELWTSARRLLRITFWDLRTQGLIESDCGFCALQWHTQVFET